MHHLRRDWEGRNQSSRERHETGGHLLERYLVHREQFGGGDGVVHRYIRRHLYKENMIILASRFSR